MSSARPIIPPPLSRTSSSTSIDSSCSMSSADSNNARRTRKRFTNVQLALLEQLFHVTTHPTREEREKIALEGNMEPKSVTIWFQNKRQTERRVTMQNAANPPNSISHRSQISSQRTSAALALPNRRTSAVSRLSLDSVASRVELPYSLSSPGRKRMRDPQAPLWDVMLSSPMGSDTPPPSPPHRRGPACSLEWACAADRERGRVRVRERSIDEETEDSDMVQTPEGSAQPVNWKAWERSAKLQVVEEDEEVMRAALALCGLGRRK